LYPFCLFRNRERGSTWPRSRILFGLASFCSIPFNRLFAFEHTIFENGHPVAQPDFAIDANYFSIK
jgi:hypothetical protein